MAAYIGDIDSDAQPEDTSRIQNFSPYMHLFNSSLRRDNFEILIISHENDDVRARHFKELLSKKVVYNKYGRQVHPRVELHRDLIYESDAATVELDYSFSKALVVFLFVTLNLAEDSWTSFEGRVALEVAQKGKNIFLYVIHTQPEQRRNYYLPATVNTVVNLYFSELERDNDRFYRQVTDILNSKAALLFQRDYQLFNDRYEFLDENYPHLFHKESVKGGHNNQGPDVISEFLPIKQGDEHVGHCNVHKSHDLFGDFPPIYGNGIQLESPNVFNDIEVDAKNNDSGIDLSVLKISSSSGSSKTDGKAPEHKQ